MTEDQVRALADGRIYSGRAGARAAGSSTSSAGSRTRSRSPPSASRDRPASRAVDACALAPTSRGGGVCSLGLVAGGTCSAFRRVSDVQLVYGGAASALMPEAAGHEPRIAGHPGGGSDDQARSDRRGREASTRASPRRDAEVMVNAVFDSMTEALARGERIEIRGFGSFVVKHRQAREGRNPKTGRARAGGREARAVLQGRQGAEAARRRRPFRTPTTAAARSAAARSSRKGDRGIRPPLPASPSARRS